MATISFAAYVASRPAATTPLDATDQILILQGGTVKLVASADTVGVTTTLINGSLNPITLLPASGEIVYVKSDATSSVCNFAVSVVGQTMCQELENGLSIEGESIRVKLIGSNWYKIA